MCASTYLLFSSNFGSFQKVSLSLTRTIPFSPAQYATPITMLATSQTEHRLGSTSLAYHSRFTTKSQKKNNHPFSILFLPRKNMEKKQKKYHWPSQFTGRCNNLCSWNILIKTIKKTAQPPTSTSLIPLLRVKVGRDPLRFSMIFYRFSKVP